MQWEHDRAEYRVRFPVPERPQFTMGERSYAVVDCSSAGLRYALEEEDPEPPIGARLEGRVRFRRGSEVEVAGVVVRIQEREVALHLAEKGIPFRLVLDEQRHLRAHYPEWK